MGPTYNRCKNGCDDVKTVSVHLGRAAKEGGTQPTDVQQLKAEIAALILVLCESIESGDEKKTMGVIKQMRQLSVV